MYSRLKITREPPQDLEIDELRVAFIELQCFEQAGNTACRDGRLYQSMFAKHHEYDIRAVSDLASMARRYLGNISCIHDNTRTINQLQVNELARHCLSPI